MRRALFTISLLALALPGQALARGEFDPTKEFEQHEWVPIHLGPLDLSITKAVVYLMLGSVLTMLLGIVLMRWRLNVEPNTRQTFGETIYDVAQIADRGAGAAFKGDRALVPVRGEPVPVHLRRQPDRLHPAAADRRDLARIPGLGHLRSDLLDLGDAGARRADLRLHAFRRHSLERSCPLLQELDPRRAEGAARADRPARDPRTDHAPDLAQRPSLREHACGAHPDPHVHRPHVHPGDRHPGAVRRSPWRRPSTSSRS